MGRKKNRNDLKSLVPLGHRLRELRLRAGISQMKLAEAMGFNPAHGYKYILRLEKGLVPNPTIHTLASLLKACNATWHDLVDVLPALIEPEQIAYVRTDSARPAEPEAGSAEKPQPPSAPKSDTQVTTPAQPKPLKRDTRPLRERLWAERRKERLRRMEQLWTRIAQAEERANLLLRPLKPDRAARQAYLSYLRSVCSLLDAYQHSRPGQAEKELTRLLQSGVDQGLDRSTLIQIQAICTEVIKSE
ncbi:MAG: helix-turn-helix domain-containing protein [candidate division WOR-3 bacterium]